MKKETEVEIPAKEEAPEKESTEKSKGKESKVPLSEEFQREVVALIEKASKDECAFICDKAYERQEVLRKAEEGEPTMDDFKAAMD